MEIYKTTIALGYQEVSYFIKVTEKDYLCIYEDSSADNFFKPYHIGEIEEFLDQNGLEKVDEEYYEMILKLSSLYGKFLFNYFINDLKNKE